MVDYRREESLGARIAAARRMRGIRSAKALADLIGNGTVTEPILQNIETGRLTNISLSQLLNIAFALKVAPSFLLAPLGRPQDQIDLPNLSAGLSHMSVAEFDAWLIGDSGGQYRSTTAGEMNERNELAALRDLERLTRERLRLQTLASLERSDSGERSGEKSWARTEDRIAIVDGQIDEVKRYLETAGWQLSGPEAEER